MIKKMAELSSISPSSDDRCPEPSLLPGEIVVAKAINVLRFQTMANRKSGISGVLYATNFRMSFLTRNPSTETQLNSVFQSNPDLSQAGDMYTDMQRELHIPQTCITDIFYYSSSTAEGSKVKKMRPGSRMSSKVHSLEIRCKDFRVVRFGLKFTPKKDHVKMVNAIAHYKTPSSIVLLFAFPYSMAQNCSEDGGKGRLNTIPTFRTLPDWLNELSRLQVDDTWRVATVNSNFQTCPSLSEMFVVLASLSDSDINRMSLHYVDSRLPMWCWSDPKTGIPMLCSGAGRLVLLKPHVACSIYSVISKIISTYSQTSHQRPPKMSRFSGLLQKVVAYESRARGGLFQKEVQHIYLFEDNLLHTFS